MWREKPTIGDLIELFCINFVILQVIVGKRQLFLYAVMECYLLCTVPSSCKQHTNVAFLNLVATIAGKTSQYLLFFLFYLKSIQICKYVKWLISMETIPWVYILVSTTTQFTLFFNTKRTYDVPDSWLYIYVQNMIKKIFDRNICMHQVYLKSTRLITGALSFIHWSHNTMFIILIYHIKLLRFGVINPINFKSKSMITMLSRHTDSARKSKVINIQLVVRIRKNNMLLCYSTVWLSLCQYYFHVIRESA